MKFDIIVCDPPYMFGDKISMSSVARGAAANYSTLSIEDIKKINVSAVASDDAILALWVPSSLLQEGLDIMAAWKFRQTQTHVWVKIKINPFESIVKDLKKLSDLTIQDLRGAFETFDLNEMLGFGMGRLFRQCHEICLIGVRGKVYDKIKNKSQRSVHFAINKKHSAKPENLQDMLELMWPGDDVKKLEMFARRARSGWYCVGNQSPESFSEDIRDSIENLIKLP